MVSDDIFKKETIDLMARILNDEAISNDLKNALFVACGIVVAHKHQLREKLDLFENSMQLIRPNKRRRGRPRTKSGLQYPKGYQGEITKRKIGAPQKHGLGGMPRGVCAQLVAWRKLKTPELTYREAARQQLTSMGINIDAKYIKQLAEAAKRLSL